jgi:uncharacterized protein with von Willebrand factor type A (vWA) domain
MHRALSEFAHVLREAGVRVSAAELIDAARALDTLSWDDRDAVRTAISITLAKRREDVVTVENVFDRFFVTPAWSRKKRKRKKRSKSADSGGGAIPGEGSSMRPSARPSPPRTMESPAPADEPRQRAAEGLRADRKARAERLERDVRRARTGSRYEAARSPHRRLMIGESDEAARIGHKPFRDRWTPSEEARLLDETARALAALRLRAVRRRRRYRRGRISIRRVMRENLAHGGVPFRIPHTRRRLAEPDLLLLVDVSGSVARAAASFFALSIRLDRRFRRVRPYVFVDRAVDASPLLDELLTLDGRPESLNRALRSLPDLNPLALSDYGRALYHVWELEGRRLRRNTITVILGDARNNHQAPSAWVLGALADRCRRVMWLNPEPVEEWDRGDSVVADYAPFATFFEVADFDGIRHACNRLARI